MAQSAYLTEAGLAKLKSELVHLKKERRQEVAHRIQVAKEIGGTVDNADYDEAKNEQSFIEGRALELEDLIERAQIIFEHRRSPQTVDVGTSVTVSRDGGRKVKYAIVGSTEADPSNGKISNVSPIGKALLGRRVGDQAEINVPSGYISLKIVKIS